jgi:hypothetical protein
MRIVYCCLFFCTLQFEVLSQTPSSSVTPKTAEDPSANASIYSGNLHIETLLVRENGKENLVKLIQDAGVRFGLPCFSVERPFRPPYLPATGQTGLWFPIADLPKNGTLGIGPFKPDYTRHLFEPPNQHPAIFVGLRAEWHPGQHRSTKK